MTYTETASAIVHSSAREWTSAEIFPGMCNVNIFAKISQVADDAMQKYARETLSLTTRPHHKEDALCYNNGHKNALRWQQ